MSDIEFSTRGLDKLIRSLKGPTPTIQVGVLGGKIQRTEQKKSLSSEEVSSLMRPIRQGKHLDNAEIGAIHEYGCPARGIPVRSFLRVPLSTRLQKEMEQAGAFDDKSFAQILRAGTILPWIKKVAVLTEKIVVGAFDSGGYGKWPAWKGNYQNNTGQILVDTTQLRNSITSRVVEDE